MQFFELRIPKVCCVQFHESKGWDAKRVIRFMKGFKKGILTDYTEPEHDWEEDFKRGFLFADRCRHFCTVNNIDLANIRRAGIWHGEQNELAGSGHTVRRRPSRNDIFKAKFNCDA